MALFMDVHSIEGSGVDVADARQADLVRQLTHGVDYLRDGVEENTVHPEAHGFGSDEVYSVRVHS